MGIGRRVVVVLGMRMFMLMTMPVSVLMLMLVLMPMPVLMPVLVAMLRRSIVVREGVGCRLGEKSPPRQRSVGMRYKRDADDFREPCRVQGAEQCLLEFRPRIDDGRCEHIPSDSSHSIEIYPHVLSLSSLSEAGRCSTGDFRPRSDFRGRR